MAPVDTLVKLYKIFVIQAYHSLFQNLLHADVQTEDSGSPRCQSYKTFCGRNLQMSIIS
jgi:hypothetical protein